MSSCDDIADIKEFDDKEGESDDDSGDSTYKCFILVAEFKKCSIIFKYIQILLYFVDVSEGCDVQVYAFHNSYDVMIVCYLNHLAIRC